MSFVIFDPIKSSFFLIFSLLCVIPLLSLFGYLWFSYFVCLLFLSGIFVILVYFSSLSKLVFVRSNFVFLVFLLSFLNFFVSFVDLIFLNLNVFYFLVYLYLLVFILLTLVFFMNFSSYFLSFSGALRKF